VRVLIGEGSDSRPTYLREVQGLRTVAALLVATYHIWLQRVSGGVDVFFVIAAYFLTRTLIKRETIALTHVRDFYLSTLRRVVPGAAVVILATIVLGVAILPRVVWETEIRHAAASMLLLENWQLARDGADYLAQGMASSPFLQMWALSLQVQLYAILPIVVWLCGVMVTRIRRPSRDGVLLAVLGLIFTASLAWSVYETAVNQPRAYFDTAARAWEFAVGALLALTIERVTITRWLARIVGMAALVVLVTFALVINVSARFPGYMALVPVLAAAAIVVAAVNGADLPLLGWRPIVRAGDISFAFYLWHWPLLTFVRLLLARDAVGVWPGIGIILASGLLAWATTRLVETPFRRHAYLSARPWLALAGCAVLMIPAGGAVSAWHFDYEAKAEAARHDLAMFVASGQIIPEAGGTMLPDSIIAREDLPPVYADRCHQSITRPKLIECTYGQRDGSTVIVLVGGSHSAQWLPALEGLAASRGLKIINMTKSACYFGLSADGERTRDGAEHDSCRLWNEAAMRRIIEIAPDLVFTISTRPVSGVEGMSPGYLAAWRKLEEHRIRLLGLRDNPWFAHDVPYCLELHASATDACGMERSAFFAAVHPTRGLGLHNAYFADFTDDYCPGGFCPAVARGVLRYRDRGHLTRTYVLTLKERLGGELDAALAEGRGDRRVDRHE
jgi:peptidoglycan/LPS O-acetylase OafA/YrhL